MKKIITFLFFWAALAIPAAAELKEPHSFLREDRAEKVPLWSFSGDQGADGTFYLVDTVRRAVIRYSRDGKFLSDRTESQLFFRDREFQPTAVQVDPRDSSRLLVQSFRTDLLLFEAESLNFMDPVPLGLKNETGDVILRLNSWVAAEQFLLAYAEIEEESGDWYSAFVRVPFEESAPFSNVGDRIEADDPIRIRQNLGHSYIALGPDGNEAFVLLDNDRELLQVGPDSVTPIKLSLGEKDLTYQRPWQEWNKKGLKLVAQLGALEKADTVAHFFADEDYFYLIRRAQRKWFLSRIDRDTGRVKDQKALPTRAHHLLVIPGENEPQVVAKGRIRAIGDLSLIHIRTCRRIGMSVSRTSASYN